MVLRGILDRALGGQVVFRGFAELEELARISKADPSFQRDLIKDHKKEIQEFLKATNQYLFFPEVILSHKIVDQPERKDDPLGPIDHLLTDASKYQPKDSRIKYRVKTATYSSSDDKRGKETIKILTISIDDDLIEERIQEGSPLFHRIDGNHRLSASEKIDDSTVKTLSTPFCMILFEERFIEKYNDEKDELELVPKNDEKTKKFERVVFHNINSKSIPLESEDILKGIIDSEELFSNKDLKDDNSFGWPYYATRMLLDTLPAKQLKLHYPSVAKTFSEKGNTDNLKWRSCVKRIFEFLSEHPNKVIDRRDSSVQKVLKCIRDLENILQNKLGDYSTINTGLSIAIIYFLIKYNSKKELDVFLKWVKSNHIYELNDLDPHTIHNIYSKIKEAKSRKVFVSMPFSDNDSEAKYEVMKKAIEEINEGLEQNLELRPIRIDWFNPGYSYAVTDEILKLIDDSGYLIADLSGKNPNVYHEVGYLMGLNEKGNGSNNFLFVCRRDEEEDFSKQLGFNLKHLQVKAFDEVNELEEIVLRSLKEFYEI